MHNLRVCLGVLTLAALASCSKQEADDTGTSGTGSTGAGSTTGAGNTTGTASTTSTGSTGAGSTNGTASTTSTGSTGAGSATGTGSTTSTGSTGAGSTNGTGSTTSTGSTGAGSTTSTGGSTGVTACTKVSGETKSGTAPPVIEFALDNTNSMSTVTPSTKGATKWVALQRAFTAAIPTLAAQHPDYAIGLTYFHYRGYGPPGNPCTDALQAIEIAPLTSQQSTAIVNNVNAENQIQMTPTQDIWQFSADHVLAWGLNDPIYAQSNRYVVVMTDGVPTVGANCTTAAPCNGAQGISVAQYAPFITAVGNYKNTKGLTTFMVAVPGAEALDQVTCSDGSLMYTPIDKEREVAAAGGTSLIDLTTSQTTDFTAALIDVITNQIAGNVSTVVSCNYKVPDPPQDPATGANQVIDKDAIEVWYYSNGGTSCTSDAGCGSGHCSPASAANPGKCYTMLERSDDCSNANGWHYSDTTQTSIQLCTNACDTAQQDTGAKIEVMIGCLVIG